MTDIPTGEGTVVAMGAHSQRLAADVSVVLPAFNTGDRLGRTVVAAAEALADWVQGGVDRTAELLVVDDGSTDGSAASALAVTTALPDVVTAAVNIRWLHHHRNLGKGAALRTGMRAALERPTPHGGVVAFIDGDGDIPVGYVVAFSEQLVGASDGTVGVVGSKRGGTVDAPVWRRVASAVFQVYARLMLPTAVHDTQVGVKAFAAPWLDTVLPVTREQGFLFDLELLGAARAGHHRVCQAPVTLHIDGSSSTISAATAARMARQLFVLSVRTRRGRRLSPPPTPVSGAAGRLPRIPAVPHPTSGSTTERPHNLDAPDANRPERGSEPSVGNRCCDQLDGTRL
jgi:dolichyl-phosphate beta-glucosyltransferase